MSMSIFPKKLKKGDTIGIAAPAGSCTDINGIYKGIDLLKRRGFNVIEGKNIYRVNNYLAGDDEKRVEDINEFFQNKSIDGIMCLRGGYGSIRILDKIDYKAIIKNPKVFIGYSDITSILCAINKLCDLVTFHGPMLYSDFSYYIDEYTYNSMEKCIMINKPYGIVENPISYKNIKGFNLKDSYGKIIGGNLTTIISTLGTAYEIDTDNKILFIEDINEEPYKIDRMLTQLILSNKFKKCKGIILGQFTHCNEFSDRINLIDMFIEKFDKFKIPVLYNVCFGHEKLKLTIPMGVSAKITKECEFHIIEKAVQ